MESESGKGKTVFMSIILVLGTLVMAAPPGGDDGALGATLPDWPGESDWINYTFRGERVTDWEDKPYENDPTHGIANVQPAAVDIASGVDASGGGPDNNPGYYTSVQYLYEDVDGDSDGCTNLDDDWLFLRMRVADDPRHSGKFAYKAYHWDILFEVDGDIWSEFVVDLNGGDGLYKFGTVGVYYNNTDDYEYDPDNDGVWLREASKASNDYTRPVLIDYGTETEDDDQWWIEYRIPVTAFTDHEDTQLLCADTAFLLFFSTSASMTNPLQKDWMGEFVFGEPANITVVKTVEEDIIAPGGTLHYIIYYNNTGDFNANNVWVNDTIPEYTTFLESSPAYDSVDGRTYRWHFSDIAPGNYSIYLNVTVDFGVPDGTILENVAVLNYTDHQDEEQPGSEDTTETPVEGPVMTMSKEADAATADPGDVLQYTIAYENTGGGGAYNVEIKDTIPDYTTFVSSTPGYDSVDGNTYTWVIDYVAGYSSGAVLVYVSVDAYTPDGTVLVNYVTLDYEDVNGNQYDQLDDWANVTVTAPTMTLSKGADVTHANPGDQITYTIEYENTGTGDASGVVVEDTIDPDTTYVSATPAPDSIVGDVLTWNIGTVAGGATGSITLIVEVDAYVGDGAVLTNDVTLNYDDANGNPYDELSASVDVTCTAPVMTISKTADKSEANPGDQITYTITYENTGTGDATDVVIEDTIDSHTTYVSATPAPDSIVGDVLTWNIGTVSGGVSDSITLIVEVDAYVADGTVLTNTVTLNYEDANDNPFEEESDSVEVTVTAPVMTISKTADKTHANPGDHITYTITYHNTGSGVATDVVVEDTIDPDTTYVSATPAPDSIVDDVLTWNIGTVAGGASGTITLIVEVDAFVADGEIMTNIVTLNYDDANGNPYFPVSDSVDVTCIAPVMTLSKTADKTHANPGDEITYTISYENTGTGDATDVVIEDTIDPDTTYVSATPAPDSIVGDVLTWNVGTVGGGSSGSITLVVEVDAFVADGEILTNSVTLNYDDANGNPYDELSDSVEVICTAPVMTLSKTADKTQANPGDHITYTISYKNTGGGDATDVVIEDTIDPDTTYVSATPAPDSIVGDFLTWNIGTVGGGTSDSITLIVEVDAFVADGEILTNTVTLNYDDANGNPYDELSDFVEVTCIAPVMTLSKTADKTHANPGDQITYTISYENTGAGDATDVVIEDTIDPDTTFVSSTPAPDSIVGDVLTWNIGTVGGGTSDSITLIVEVDAFVGDGEILTNTVTLNYDDANGNPYDELSDFVDVTCTAPVMTITKTANKTTANPGDTIEYTIDYENTGSGDATDVVVEDTIPADTTFMSSTPAPDSIVGDVFTWNIGLVGGETSGSITLTVTVDVGTADGTLLHNTVTLNYDDANGNPQGEESDYADVTVTAPIMSLSKSANVTTADPGDTFTYTLYYENSGSGDATLVVMEDTIPSDVTFVSSSPAFDSASGDTYTWNVGTVAAHTDGTITITVQVDVGVGDGTLLHNTATLDYADANGNAYAQLDDYADVTVTAPVMSFSKSASVATADPGDTVVYTLFYENSGSGVATLVVVKDTIPSDVTFVSSSPAYDSASGNTYTWNVGTVGAHSNGTITITVQVNVGVDDGTLLHNTATLDYADANGNAYPQLDDYADVTVTAPVMSFSKSADVTEADPSDTVVYTLIYENSGSGVATLVVVEDTIPSDVTFVSSSPAYDSASGNTYTWNVGTVGAYSSSTITITVQVNAGVADGTVLHNTATLDYADANGNAYPQLDDYVDVTVTAPVMNITKTADVSTADPSDQITYTIIFTNSGTGNATNVWINDTIPADTTLVSTSPAHDSSSGDTYTWFFALVESGATVTITIVVEVDVGTDDETVLHNAVTLDYSDANGNPLDQEMAYADVVVTAPILHITKTADVSNADPGDPIVYTINYWNSGTGWASLVKIVDTIPADTTFVSSTPLPDSIVGDEYTWNIGDVAPGGSGTITITVTVDPGTPDEALLHNVVTLDYADANGNYYSQLGDYADVIVTAPVMSFTKSANMDSADPGTTITYTITYTNSGTGYAYTVIITDTIPADTTYEDSDPDPTSQSGDTFTWEIGIVPPGTTHNIRINVTVDVGTPDKTLLHNVATLDYTDPNDNSYPQQTDYADVIVTAPVLHIIKTADVSEADPGDTVVYTIEYWNSGTGWASLVEIVDTIPADTTFVSSSPAFSSVVGDEYTWIIGDVAPGGNGTIRITVTVDPGTPDKRLLHNVVTLDYADANGNSYPQLSDYADVTVTAPVMTMTKTADKTEANPGDQIVYTIEYSNTGTGWATLVVIVDTIPVDTTYVGSSLPYDSVVGDTYTWNIGDVAPGTTDTLTITVEVDPYTPDERLLHNTDTLNYADANGNSYPQLSDYADVVVTAPILHVTKTADVSEADPGDTVVYTIDYWNSGTGWASLVEIVDTIPADTTFVSSIPAFSSVSGDEYTWLVGNVAPGGSGTITIIVIVDPGTADRTLLHNEVTLDYADTNGNYYPQLDDYADVVVTAPEMSISKTVSASEADPGDILIYTLYYENTGTGDAKGVTVIDTMPVDVTFISSTPPPDSGFGVVLVWYVGDVASMTSGTITITVMVTPGTADETLLHNIMVLDYFDANWNFIEQLTDYADVIVTAPVMTLEKSAGDVTVAAYVIADFKLRIAGEKWHDVVLTLYDDDVATVFASVTRYPGSPDRQAVTLYDVKIDLMGTFKAVIEYTPLDDAINGQWWGADPCWLILTFEDGSTKRLHHTFNVRHEKTWIWTIDDFTPYIKGQDITYEATIPYTIFYENIGTGDASNVVVIDTLPAGSVVLDTNPAGWCNGAGVCTWFLGDVLSGEQGYIFINITYVFVVNGTELLNEVILRYSDANGNFVEELYDNATSVLIMPELDGHSSGDNSIGFSPEPGTDSDLPVPDMAIIASIGELPLSIADDVAVRSSANVDLQKTIRDETTSVTPITTQVNEEEVVDTSAEEEYAEVEDVVEPQEIQDGEDSELQTRVLADAGVKATEMLISHSIEDLRRAYRF